MNYFDSNRTNTVILKFEAVKVVNLHLKSYGSAATLNQALKYM
jgi:hypothetical protein